MARGGPARKELPYIQFCQRYHLQPHFAIVPADAQTKELKFFMTVQTLIGRHYAWKFDDIEAFIFRSHFYQ